MRVHWQPTPPFALYSGKSEQVFALRQLASCWTDERHGFWSIDAVLSALERAQVALVFSIDPERANAWSALALVDIGLDAVDLLYIYVHPKARQRGLAKDLLTAIISGLQSLKGPDRILLEVSPGNAAAIRLYEGLGFKKISLRPRYYQNGEDAAIYLLPLKDHEAPV